MNRVLVIGVGSIGERHVRCMLATERTRVAVCEVNDRLRADVAARYSVTEAYASLDNALQEHWDAAVVATPSHTHIPIATRLADAGVAMLIEKPLSVRLDGVDELIERVEKRRIVAAVAYVYRAHPSMAAMKEMIGSGRFGRPVQLVVVSGQNFPSYRPAYREIYFKDRNTGGGAIQDALTHLINAGEWLVGPVGRIAADAEHKVLEGVAVEDTVNVLARHGAVMGAYSLNMYQAPAELTLTVICEKGTLRFELHEQRLRWKAQPDGPAGTTPWNDVPAAIQERDDWFLLQEQSFLNALEDGARPLCTLQEGLQTLLVNRAALASADHGGRWERVCRERESTPPGQPDDRREGS